MIEDLEGLRPGDIVRLNTRAVKITVRGINNDLVVAQWMSQADELVEAEFLPQQLVFIKAADA